jgi:uncharacterized protein YkwD
MVTPVRRAIRLRRAIPLLLAGLLLLPAAAPVAATATADPSATAAQSAALAYANKERTSRGLVALHLDPRVLAVARGRAEVMAEADRLSHTQADGNTASTLLSAASIRWYGVGEIIALNVGGTLASSAGGAISQWMHSSTHRAILLSRNYNYVAFGVAVSATGKRYWAGVFIKGPDRTGAAARLYTPVKQILSAARTRVTFRWTGADVRLQVLTSGLRKYEIQRRRAGGVWVAYAATTARSMTTSWARGRTYEFRVRAVDRAGNRGTWKTVTVRL